MLKIKYLVYNACCFSTRSLSINSAHIPITCIRPRFMERRTEGMQATSTLSSTSFVLRCRQIINVFVQGTDC